MNEDEKIFKCARGLTDELVKNMQTITFGLPNGEVVGGEINLRIFEVAASMLIGRIAAHNAISRGWCANTIEAYLEALSTGSKLEATETIRSIAEKKNASEYLQ